MVCFHRFLVTGSVLSAFGRGKLGFGNVGAEDIQQLEKELQISFLEFQRDLPLGKRDPETTRELMGEWLEAKKHDREKIQRLRQMALAEQLDEIRGQRKLPEHAPVYNERNLEKFAADADAYLRDVIAYHAPTGGDVTLEDRVKARENLGAFLAQRENRELMQNLREAKASLAKGKGQMRPPLNKAALARLSATTYHLWKPASALFTLNTRSFGGLHGPGGAIWKNIEKPLLQARGLLK